MTERAIAEWDMTKAEGERAPWMHNAGWPFICHPRNIADRTGDENTEEQEEEEEIILAALYDALDCDEAFDNVWVPTSSSIIAIPSTRKLELLASVLLTLIKSLADGVIPSALWNAVDALLRARDKASQRPSLDSSDEDVKFSVLEVLASDQPHNATFLLLTSMLQRMATTIASAASPSAANANTTTSRPTTANSASSSSPSKSNPKSPRASTELPASPQVSVRRKTLSRVPAEAARQLVVRNYAVVFSGVMIRLADEGSRERDKAARRERAVRVVEMFLSV